MVSFRFRPVGERKNRWRPTDKEVSAIYVLGSVHVNRQRLVFGKNLIHKS